MNLIAVDIGGTGIKIGEINETGERIKLTEFPMPRHDYSLLIPQLISHIQQHYPNDFQGIAISSTGLVDPVTQEIGMSSPLYKAFGKELVAELASCFQVPVSAENDGNCALLAEKWVGNGQNCQNLAVIVLGTSVGGALMVNQQLVRGAHLMGGEIGYLLFQEKEKTWEIWSIAGSTRTLVSQINEQKGQTSLDGHQVERLYTAGDPVAVQCVLAFIEKLAVGCYNLQYILDPEKILIGGGISRSSFLLPLLKERLLEFEEQIPSNVRIPQVGLCRFGNDSNLIGACYHWLTKYSKIQL